MSNAATAPATSLTEKQAAALEKFADAQVEVFLNVLASRGYTANTVEKQAELLETGRLVAAGIDRLKQTKQASESGFIKQANALLAKQLGVPTAEAPAAGREKLASEVASLVGLMLQGGWGETAKEAQAALTAGGDAAHG